MFGSYTHHNRTQRIILTFERKFERKTKHIDIEHIDHDSPTNLAWSIVTTAVLVLLTRMSRIEASLAIYHMKDDFPTKMLKRTSEMFQNDGHALLLVTLHFLS